MTKQTSNNPPKKTSSRGGSRDGAGRPVADAPAGELTTRATVPIYPSHRAELEQLGGGSLAAGIRHALALLRENNLLG